MVYHEKFILTWGLTLAIVFMIGWLGPDVLARLWRELMILIAALIYYLIKPVHVVPGVTLEERREKDKFGYYWYITGVSIFVIVAAGSAAIRTWMYYFAE